MNLKNRTAIMRKYKEEDLPDFFITNRENPDETCLVIKASRLEPITTDKSFSYTVLDEPLCRHWGKPNVFHEGYRSKEMEKSKATEMLKFIERVMKLHPDPEENYDVRKHMVFVLSD